MERKRTFGAVEIVFDLFYLGTALILAFLILRSAQSADKLLFGVMTLVLVSGDSFHLIPRIRSALGGDRTQNEGLLGLGKLLTSVGMTVFYLLLWHVGLLAFSSARAALWTPAVYALGAVRILLCLLPQNRWGAANPPASWNLYRNIPFILLGAAVDVLFFSFRTSGPAQFRWMWLAILLSFACYLPVVFGAKKHPQLGMLMLPKSCAYLWIISMGL